MFEIDTVVFDLISIEYYIQKKGKNVQCSKFSSACAEKSIFPSWKFANRELIRLIFKRLKNSSLGKNSNDAAILIFRVYIYINRNFNLIVAPGTPDFQALINFSSIKKFQSAFNPDPNYRKTTTFAMMIKIKIIQKLEDQLSHYLREN